MLYSVTHMKLVIKSNVPMFLLTVDARVTFVPTVYF